MIDRRTFLGVLGGAGAYLATPRVLSASRALRASSAYVERWSAAGLSVAGRDERGEMRAFSLPARRFFLATLFQPQRSSRAGAPHPIVAAFLRACVAYAR